MKKKDGKKGFGNTNKPKKVKKLKDDKDLVNPAITDVVTTLLAPKEADGKDVLADKFCLYRAFGLPIETCAKLSGCSMSWAYKLNSKYGNDTKKLMERIAEIAGQAPDAYINLTKLKLPLLAQLDDLGIQEYKSNPRLIVEKPTLLRQLKTVTGVIEDRPETPSTISLNVAIQIQNYVDRMQSGEPKQIEADEIIDIESSDIK